LVSIPIGARIARFARERMYMSATGRSLIVGVDRLDYSKGLAERFLGYEPRIAWIVLPFHVTSPFSPSVPPSSLVT
jgi:hypothetical protein